MLQESLKTKHTKAGHVHGLQGPNEQILIGSGFSVWGSRESVGHSGIPVRMRHFSGLVKAQTSKSQSKFDICTVEKGGHGIKTFHALSQEPSRQAQGF